MLLFDGSFLFQSRVMIDLKLKEVRNDVGDIRGLAQHGDFYGH